MIIHLILNRQCMEVITGLFLMDCKIAEMETQKNYVIYVIRNITFTYINTVCSYVMTKQTKSYRGKK